MSYFRPEIVAMTGYEVPDSPRSCQELIRLNTNENAYECSPTVAYAIESTVKSGLRRYPDPTACVFREKCGEVLGVDPDWILCGNGSDDILSICLRAFTEHGQVLRLATPSYGLYGKLANIYGLQIDEVRFEHGWSIPDRFAESISDPRFAILSNPNNPSGTTISQERIQAIAEQLSCPLLIDEAYAEIAGISCLSLVAENDILIARSMSKSYALAGIRFGYVVARPEVVKQLTKVKEPYNCDAVAIAAATAAIADQEWLAECRSKICGTRTRLRAEMMKLGFEVADSHANFTWSWHERHSAKLLHDQMKRRGILVRYLDYGEHGDGLRISVGTDDEVDVCLATLRSIV